MIFILIIINKIFKKKENIKPKDISLLKKLGGAYAD